MLKYKDFVPEEIEAPGFFKEGRHESFEHAVQAANQWLSENRVALISIETVVLPNNLEPLGRGLRRRKPWNQ